MLMQLAAALALLLTPILLASMVSLSATTARQRGVRVARIMRDGPWRG